MSHPIPALMLPLCAALALPLQAQDDQLGIEGRRVAETLFATMDTNNRGQIHAGNLEEFRASVLAGMDADGDTRITYDEFSAWDPGFARVAADVGRAEAHITATRIVFAFWDQNGDDQITDRELRVAMAHDFRRADLDNDTLLTEAEFIGSFPIIIAMRAAIRPDL